MTLRKACQTLAGLLVLASVTIEAAPVEDCPGYTATNVVKSTGKITADLTLAGDACNAYGTDLSELKLLVEYQTKQRLHVKIYDADERVYQIPEEVVPLPPSTTTDDDCDMTFNLVEEPFSFSVIRTSSGEVLFDTSGAAIVFESQYLRLRTDLPDNPNLYGLGESANPFRLPTTGFHQTLWNSGEPFLPADANLYGAHNVYYDHRGSNGTHAVYMHNSNGMKIIVDHTEDTGQYL